MTNRTFQSLLMQLLVAGLAYGEAEQLARELVTQ